MTRVVTDRAERARLKHTTGRKPVDLVIDAKHPQGREAAWAGIRQLRKFTLLELEHITRINTNTLSSYLQGLTAAGYLKREQPHCRQPSTWTLVRDVGVDAPRVTRKGTPVSQGIGRECLWKSMRILPSFDLPELVETASAGGAKVSLGEATDYVLRLQRAGYIKLVQAKGPYRRARYMLVPARDSGPQAPLIQRIKQVFDPNLGKVVWPRQVGA